jgi:hypothetical protein
MKGRWVLENKQNVPLKYETIIGRRKNLFQPAMHLPASAFAMLVNKGIHLSNPCDYASPPSILDLLTSSKDYL